MESVNDNRNAAPGRKRLWEKDSARFIVFFSAITAALCYPIILHIQGHLGGPPTGDKGTNLWNLWWVYYALFERHVSPLRCDMIFIPWGCDLRVHTLSIANGLIAAPVTAYFGANVSYNLLFFFWTLWTGVFASLWARRFGLGMAASAFIGFLAAFNPYRWAHQAHLNLFSTAWLFFAFWQCERMLENGSKRSLVLFIIAWLLALFTDWYYGLFTGIYLTVRLLSHGAEKKDRAALFRILRIAAISGAAMLAALLAYFYRPNAGAFQEIYIDPVGMKYSAYWSLDLLHLLLPAWLIYSLQLPLLNYGEFQIHPGLAILLPSLFFIIADHSFWKNRSQRGALLVIAAVFLFLSLGPVIKFKGEIVMIKELPFFSPTALFEKIPFLTVIRVYARFAYVGFLCLVLAGVIGWEKWKPALRGYSAPIYIVLGLCFLLETWWRPPLMGDYSFNPAIFNQNSKAILELPFTPSNLSGLHLYHQTFHHKPIHVVEFSRLGRYKERYLEAHPALKFLNLAAMGEDLAPEDEKYLETRFCADVHDLGSVDIVFQSQPDKNRIEKTRLLLKRIGDVCRELKIPLLIEPGENAAAAE